MITLDDLESLTLDDLVGADGEYEFVQGAFRALGTATAAAVVAAVEPGVTAAKAAAEGVPAALLVTPGNKIRTTLGGYLQVAGPSTALGPAAVLSNKDGQYQVKVGGTVDLYARVLLHGIDITQADVEAITYTIYSLGENDARTEVAGHVGVSVAVDAIRDELVSVVGATSWNFTHEPDVRTHDAFTAVGTEYLVQYTITPADGGQDVLVRFRLVCK